VSDVLVRRASDDELPAIIELASAALGWREGEPNQALFDWKHRDNVFGRSPMWVAEVEGRLAGFRTFLRWEWERADGRTARAVRAVDTATHPDFQGRGVFTTLTLGALAELGEEGVDFVFNTPNAQSRPGYLKMGWQTVGRLPVRIRPSGVNGLVRMASSRVPAEKWSLATDAGERPDDVFADAAGIDALLSSQPAVEGLRTRRSSPFLAWRYGLEPLAYRVILAGRATVDGFLVFRLRMRGGAIEAVVADVVVPGGSAAIEQRLVQDLARRSGADYLIRLDRRRFPPGRFVPLPRQGPIMTWRAVNETEMPPLDQWDVRLGDIELF
jgi:GNAT superfamily N-acetyltransferase